MAHRKLQIDRFISSEDHILTGTVWTEWLEDIERQFRYFKITEAEDKKDALIIFGGREIARLEKNLPNPEGDIDVYTRLKTKLNDYFTPKKNKHHARYIFLKMKPYPDENTVMYAARVREEANKCEFGDNNEDRILEHLIQAVEDTELIKKAISKKWNLTQFLNEAAQSEDMKLQMKQMYAAASEPKVAKIKTRNKPKGRGTIECGYCGTNTHGKGKNCPAFGKKCFKCNKYNHFSKICKKGKDSEQSKSKYRKSVKKTEEVLDEDNLQEAETTSSDDDFFPHVVKHLTMIKKIQKQGESCKTIKVKIDDVDVLIEPDSGAEVNVMDEHQFKAFVHRTENKTTLVPTSIKLNTLQASLQVKGEFSTVVRNKTCGIKTKFLIIKGKIGSPPLIGKPALMKLGMLKINPDGGFSKQNGMRIQPSVKKIGELNGQISEILNRYKAVFEGIGEIKGTMAKFTLQPDAQPVAQKPRPIVISLQWL